MPARVRVRPEGPVRYPFGRVAVCDQGYSATCSACGVLSLTGWVPHRTFSLSAALEQARTHLRRFHP